MPTITAIAVAAALAACTPAKDPLDQAESAIPASPNLPTAPGRLPQRTPATEETLTESGGRTPPASAAAVKQHERHKIAAPAVAVRMDGDRAGGLPLLPPPQTTTDRENYGELEANGIKTVADNPVSTLSIDVDTAAYANVRRMLNEGRLPPQDAVRIEELVNYFDYADPAPASRETPFAVTTELAATPWNSDTKLLRVALRAWDIEEKELPPSNLVFLIDVSGSMNQPDKLPLLKRSLKLLTKRLDREDRITLVVYAGAAGVALEPTAGNERATIEQALDELQAGGSTHGSAGIRLAYAKAREAFIADGINRVILATDGDFNVGTVDHRALLDLIEHEREAGIALTTLGFGRGNLNDHLMEQLADHGNGNAAYIDSLLEAQKVLVEQIGGTLYTIASDVKLQVEFNPYRVAEYRLIGYENRLLRREDFNNDRVDAGELGAGHSVVALYEIAETDSAGRRIDPLRYAVPDGNDASTGLADEYAFVKLRYKPRGKSASRLLTYPVNSAQIAERPSNALHFSAAVAAFGQKLRGGDHLGDYGFEQIRELARSSRGPDDNGYRADFIRLVGLADALAQQPPAVAARNGSG
jgi:Ca-activated chloride channel family protein